MYNSQHARAGEFSIPVPRAGHPVTIYTLLSTHHTLISLGSPYLAH